MFKRQCMERGRSKGKFVMVRPRTEHARNSVRYQGPLTWNLLNVEVRSSSNKGTYSKKLKDCKQDKVS